MSNRPSTSAGGQYRSLVIIPAYNESTRVGDVVRSIRETLPGVPVLVIDDSSHDDTRRQAQDAGALTISHVVNLGYGAALESGYLYALAHGYDVVVQMDADGQHLVSEVQKIYELVREDKADIVLGSRYLDGGKPSSISWMQRLGQKLFSWLFFVVTGVNVTDPTSGFQCLNRRAMRLFATGAFPHDYPDTDVLLMAHFAGLRILETPVVMAPRAGGVSIHSGLKPIYYVMKMLVSMLMVTLNRRRWKNYEP